MFATPVGRTTPYPNANIKSRHAWCVAYRRHNCTQNTYRWRYWLRRSVANVSTAARLLVAKTAIALVLLIAIGTSGQESPRPSAVATKLTTLPTLDGEVRGDPAWQSLMPITDFTQWQPTNGAPATRKTEVYFAFSDEFLHVGVICHEPSQDDIVLSSDGFQSDSFAMAIDTFLNGQTGFMFGTNPIGVEYDAALDNEYADWNWSTT